MNIPLCDPSKGMFIANLKLITGSFGFSSSSRDQIVTFVSLANAFGRLSAGGAMECCETLLPVGTGKLELRSHGFRV